MPRPAAPVAAPAAPAEPVAAEPAAAKEPVASEIVANGNAPEETNVWPDEAAESAFLAGARERGEAPRARPSEAAPEPEPKALPPLDELVQQIPAPTRELLEDLFRARFTTVRRIRKSDLKV